MAIFKFNYNKEGKGIEKNAPEKNIFFTYFESFTRNFWSLIKTNFLYIVSSIPMILILAVIFTGFIYPNIQPKLTEYIANSGAADTAQTEATYLGVYLMVFVTEILLLIGSGPASASLAYAAKCMTNEEHVWIWSDFKGKFIENFKQSIIVSIVDIVVLICIMYSMFFYSSAYSSTGKPVFFVMYSILIIFSLLFCFMHMYLYQFIVTFENKLWVIYKNAFLLAIAKLPQNLFLTAISVLFTYFLFTVLAPGFAAILTLVFWYVTMRYPTEFYAARTIKKIIDNNSEKTVQPEKGSED